jgi:4-hydroxy-3-methylbut-2-enyl diphosphate reductase IspH
MVRLSSKCQKRERTHNDRIWGSRASLESHDGEKALQARLIVGGHNSSHSSRLADVPHARSKESIDRYTGIVIDALTAQKNEAEAILKGSTSARRC